MREARRLRLPILLVTFSLLSAASSAERPPWLVNKAIMPNFKTLLATGAFFLLLACQNQSRMETPPPKRDINEVLTANSSKLMALPSVGGVYVGLMPDEK